jgi:hypothetical protein
MGTKPAGPVDDQARLPLQFLPDVKRGLDHCGIAWIELDHAEADDVIATVVHATAAPRPVIRTGTITSSSPTASSSSTPDSAPGTNW